MTFEVVTRSGQAFSLSAMAKAIQLQDRVREYAISHGRAVEGPNWETFGDELEQPSQIRLRLYLKDFPGVPKGMARSVQRDAIEQIETAIAGAVLLRNYADLREYVVRTGHVTSESPTEDSYVLELTFWPTVRRAEFLEGFPLGRLRIVSRGEGRADVVPLDGVSTSPGTYVLNGTNGATFTFQTLEATYG